MAQQFSSAMTGSLSISADSQATRPALAGAQGSAYAAHDGKHYWNCWTENYQWRRDGYCIHVFCEEDKTGRTLCGVVASNGGGEAYPRDGAPSCRKCLSAMQRRGALKPNQLIGPQ